MLRKSQVLNSAEGAPTLGDLFEGLPEGKQTAFEALEVKSSYPSGFTLFAQGQAPRGLFVIHRGAAKLSMSGSQTQQVVLRTARQGEILGLSATVSGESYEITAETKGPCDTGFVARDDFLVFLRDNPDVTFRVVQVLSSNLNAIFEQSRGPR